MNRFASRVLFAALSVLLSVSAARAAAPSEITVRLPVDAQVTVVKEGLACLICTPDGVATLLGEERMQCGSRDESAPRLYVEAHALLGGVRFTLG